MIKTPPLSDDPDTLKALLIKQQNQLKQLQSDNKTLSQKNEFLQEQLNLALARRYAASSEKITADQLRLFDEAENDIENSNNTEAVSDTVTVTVEGHTRKKTVGRKTLPANLPRIEVVHELSDVERVCDHDGNTLTEIGEVTSEQLDIIPATIQVIKHIRKKYACSCGQCIKTAPLSKQPIPKSIASPGLLAHTSQYQNTRMPYRCIDKNKFYTVLVWLYRVRHWQTG